MATLKERLDAYGKSGDTRSLAERMQSYKTAGRDSIVGRLDKWFANNEIFVSNYQKRTAGTTGSYDDKYDSETSSWLETVTNQKNNFDTEANSIKSYLEANRDEFDSEWLKNTLSSLSEAQKYQDSILAGTKSLNDYWTQWDSEESYNKWVTGMKDREAKLNYDLRAGKADISRLETIQSNASAIMKRITELENTLEERRKYALRMGTTTLIDSSKEEAELAALKAEYESKYKNIDLDSLGAEINDKKAYYTLAERLQSAEALKNDAMSAPDFETYAAKGAAVKNPTYAEATGSDNLLGWSNPFAKKEIANIVTYVRDNDEALQKAANGAANSGDIAEIEGIRLYNLLKEDEVKVYNYYIGKGDKESANAYLESLTDTLNERKAGERYQELEGNTFLEVMFGVEAGIDQFVQGVSNLFNSEDYIPTTSTQYLSQMVREDLADNGATILGSSLGQIGYDLITTTSNMLPSILIGGAAGTALLGATAAGNAKAEMLRLGYNQSQATAYGLLVGASEGLLEYAFSGISRLGGKAWEALGKSGIASMVDNILGNISVKAPGVVVALGKILGGAAGEAFEEGLQSILEPWFENIVVGGDLESPDWAEVAYSSLLGALSAGVLESAGNAANVTSVSRVGNKINKAQGISRLVELGHTYSADTVAYKLAGKINDVIKSGGKVNAYSIGRLFIEEGATLSSQNISDLTRGLEDLGWDSKSAATMANAYAELLDGTIEMTDDVRMIFSENQPLTQALIKKLINENTTVYQRTKGYSDLGKTLKTSTASVKESVAKTPELSDEDRAAYEAAEAMIRADQKKLGFQASRDIARGMVEETAPARDAVDRVYKALNVKGEYGYSEGKGVTVKSTGEAAEVADVVSTKDGNLKVKLTDGKTIDAKELNFRSEGEALVYETVANLGVDPVSAWSIIKNYDPNGKQRGDEYALGAVEAFRYGKLGEKNISSRGFAAKLSESQRKLAYDLGRFSAKNEAEARQKRISEAVSKMAKKRARGALTYDKSVDVSSLREEQKAQADILGKVAEGLGVKVHLFASSEVDGKAYFKAPDGSEISDNGWYDPETGEIWVDVNAGNSRRGLILITAAHELTHFIKDWSPAKYKVFADFLVKTYNESGKSVDELVRDRMNKSKHDLSYDEAYDEIVARSCESFLMDRDVEMRIAEITNKDKILAQKIKTFIGQLLAKLKKLAEDLGLAPESEEAKLVAGMTDTLQELHNLWVDALADAGKSYSKVGMAIDMSSESASPMFSERTWTASEYVTDRDAAAKKLVEALGVTYAQAKKYIDNVNSIAKAIANDRARLDYEASSFGSAFVSNVEYGGSFDYTTLCKKRRIYTGTFQEIQKRIGDAVLSPDDILEIRNMMLAEGIEATCGLCYVEGSRANMGKFAKKFIELYKRDNPEAWTPTMVDVNTPDGVEQMRINHPEAYEQYEYFWNHYGKLKEGDPALFASQQKPKLYEARKEYKGEILQHFKDVDAIAKKNLNGGIRMQSFSDFEIVHLIDTMQVIMDMAQVGLAGQAYTKVPEFAEAFGNTGLKINLSLIAKGVDSDGKLIFDDREGMPHETAFKLRDKYSANVGTIIVAFTDDQLRAAMADPRIDFIIPFHRSQWKKSQYGAMGLPKGTKDYTFMQNEKLIKQTYHEYQGRMVKDKATNYKPNEYWDFSKSGKENAEAYLEMCAKENKRPKFYKLLDYDGNGKYSLKADGSTDGYWKLLIDFKMYDNDGVGVPQSAVTPNFSMDEAMTMLDEYKGGHQKYPIAHGVVDEFVKKYNSKAYSTDFSKTTLPVAEMGKFSKKQFSERDTDAITEREVLAEALESAAQNDIERARLKEYKAEIGKYEGLQEELRGVRAEITEIYNSTGKRDTERLRALKDRATELETNISTYDKKLLRLEAAKPLRNVLKREVESTKYAEKVAAREKEANARLAGRMAQGRIDAETIRKKDEQIKALREQRDRKLLEQKENFREQKERAAERRDKTAMRAKIRDRVNSLNKLLLNETKDKHVPMHLQKPVAELLSIINMESSDNEKVKAKLQVLKSEYEAIAKSNDPIIAAGYHPEVAERIGSVAEFIGDTALKDMDLEQLDYLYETLTIVESVIRKANKGFKIAKGQTIESYAQSTMAEIRKVGGSDHMSNEVLDVISRYRWSNLKPVYAFERIGSKTFTELFNNVRAGEDVWATDVSEARSFFLENANKYDFFGWDMEKTYTFKDKFGKDFELTLPQMMSLYAYSKRAQADLHLEEGGFVYEDSVKVKKRVHGIPISYTVKTASTHALRREHLALVVAAMTEEQRAFVDAMQDYLSTTMGEKGNEVSREMYGINLFKEKNYFPLKSSSYYMSYNPEKDAQSKIKNYGMAKELVKNANNPIVLSDFMKVWGQHIDEMSMYHAFVLPMEDFSKVFNFNTPTSDDVRKQSVQAALTDAYGDAAIAYIKGLMTDLNGGARSDPTLGVVNSLMSKFKKAKVFLSWSVIVQQPSAIGRSFALVDPKYFKPNLTQGHGKTWEELKKYAPVAIIKEMGYFDTNVGQSTVDYLSAPEYRGLWQKAKGILTDENYRDAAMGKLPSLADEATWNYIWQAVKNEIADTTELEEGSEDFLKAAGARFTEVVTKTQVYDSVLSRSAFMRSKDGLAKMITAFLAEPTTSANMMSNALLQSKRGDKKGLATTAAAVVTSVALNSVLVSLVRAMRDDDEDESWGEKYVESLISEMLDGLNPITYLPVLKDIWSIAQGYDVERTDMSLFADLIAAIETLFNDSKTALEKVEGLAASSANFAGLPLENVIRDVKSVINLAKLIDGDLKTTPGGLEDAAINAVRDTIPFIDKLIPSESKSDKLYEAILRGDEVEIERAESGYSDEDAVASATKKALRENDPRVRAAARALADNDIREFGRIVSEIASEGKFDSETVESAVRSEADSFKSKIKAAAEALRDGNNDEYQSIVRQLRKAYRGVYSQDEIVAAIKAYKFTEKEEEVTKIESIYKSSDVNAAFDAGDDETALKILRELVSVKYENEIAKAKREAEESGERFIEWRAKKDAEAAAQASVKSSLTSYWKPLYKEAYKRGDSAEMYRIRAILSSSGLYGSAGDVTKTVKDWLKS